MSATFAQTADKLRQTADSGLVHYESMTASVHEIIDAFWQRVPYLAIGLTLFILFWLLSRWYKVLVKRLLQRRMQNRMNLLLVLQRVGSAFILFTGFLFALMIAVPGFTPGQLVSALGIGSVAIGFAFKDIFQNLLSGILLLLNEPFKIGDRIVSGSFEGTVTDIEIRATTLETYDGRRIVIPNSQLFTSPVTVNTRHGLHRLTTTLTAAVGSDPVALKADILAELKQNCGDHVRHPEITITELLAGGGATLLLSWWASDNSNNNEMCDEVLACVNPLLTPPEA